MRTIHKCSRVPITWLSMWILQASSCSVNIVKNPFNLFGLIIYRHLLFTILDLENIRSSVNMVTGIVTNSFNVWKKLLNIFSLSECDKNVVNYSRILLFPLGAVLVCLRSHIYHSYALATESNIWASFKISACLDFN